MSHRKEHSQKLSKTHLRRVVVNVHNFGVAGATAANCLIIRCFGGTTGISRFHTGYTGNGYQHRLNAPETAPGQDNPGLAPRLMQVFFRGRKPATRHGQSGDVACVTHQIAPADFCLLDCGGSGSEFQTRDSRFYTHSYCKKTAPTSALAGASSHTGTLRMASASQNTNARAK